MMGARDSVSRGPGPREPDAHGAPVTDRPLRLALYGSIAAESGSMATAFFRIVEEWLREGHELDLYSPGNYIDPAGLVREPRFRYVQVGLEGWKRATRFTPKKGLPRVARTAIGMGLSEAQRVLHEGDVASAILRAHAERPYDALVVLNRLSRFSIPKSARLPVVSFAQGSPNGEGEFVHRRGDLVRGECGWSGWALLQGGYTVKDPGVVRSIARSDFVVVPSEWTASMFHRAGCPREKMAVVWPPVDLARFTPAPRPAKEEDFRFLWLGRVVPRKRFPLALAALSKLRARRPGAKLVVMGGTGYGGMITYRLPELVAGAERGKPVPNTEVPSLLATFDAILQPSENENFGGAAAEGLACGVPSVLGPTNGTADALEEMAFRFDRYEPDAVAAAMERAMDAVLADPSGIAKRARVIAERNLAITVAARRSAELVRAVAEGPAHDAVKA